MKSGRIFTGVLLGAVMALAATAYAAEKATVEIQKAVTVSGTQLAAGKYTVTWEGSGTNVELKIMKGKNVVATVPAQVVNLNSINLTDAVVTRNEAGRFELTQIQPGGKKVALVLGAEAVQTAAQNSTGK